MSSIIAKGSENFYVYFIKAFYDKSCSSSTRMIALTNRTIFEIVICNFTFSFRVSHAVSPVSFYLRYLRGPYPIKYNYCSQWARFVLYSKLIITVDVEAKRKVVHGLLLPFVHGIGCGESRNPSDFDILPRRKRATTESKFRRAYSEFEIKLRKRA